MKKEEMKSTRPLIVSYSYSGNTQRIAREIQAVTGGDWSEIYPWQPYPMASGAAGAGPAGDPVGMPSQAAGKFQVSPPLWGDLCGFSRTGVAGILEWKEKEEV